MGVKAKVSDSIARARKLRKQPTDAENILWSRLRYRQLPDYRFRQQAPIGKYIVDFLCYRPRLIVELDGGQHQEQADYDNERTRWLESRGFKVIRFWNDDVLKETDGVLEAILIALREAS